MNTPLRTKNPRPALRVSLVLTCSIQVYGGSQRHSRWLPKLTKNKSRKIPSTYFSCPVPSDLPHRSHCVPMNMNRSVAVFSVMMVFEKFVSIRPRFVSFNRQIPPPFAALLVLITVLVTARWFAVRSLLYKRVLNLYLGRIIQICQQDSAANRLVFPTIGRVVFDLYRIFFGAIDNQPRCGSSLPNCYERIYHFSSLFLGEMA